ncbi:MAG: aminopeptidase P family protein [Ruminococcaceae bacterium]|nr:aminopeptidase P family protein [Oscillospiraceae bacterium]
MSKLDILRSHMKNHNISAVVIPTADMHLSEYISDYYKLREYLSGFTGSAGTLVVTDTDAGLWTDGRYYIQAEKELAKGISLYRASEKDCIKIYDFLKNNLSEKDTVGLDGRLFSKKYLDEFIAKLGEIKVNTDYDASEIWENRPAEPCKKAFVLDEKYCGEDTFSKLSKVRELMKKDNFTHYLVSAPDCIMWLLNIRGNDVKYTPVTLSYLMMTEKNVTLYTKREKLTDEVLSYLKLHNIDVADYTCVYFDVENLPENSYVAADFSLTNYTLINKISSAKKNVKDFIYNLKCIKNDTELENVKRAYVKENVALTKAFYEIYHSRKLNEWDVVEIIEKHRNMQEGYFSPSFDTIAAFGENAAMVHYSPEKDKCSCIGESGLLLIDTGGQYFEGTTDATRTLALGKISDKEKEALTLVLKSHIAILTAVFPEGTKCSELDSLARMPLWKKGLDYRHSTGHGIGYMLSVHEGPQRLSSACNEVVKINMTFSDEPGVYIENEFGIRTENHLCVKENFETEYGKFLGFEVLNYCPIGTEGLLSKLLDRTEIEWLNNYNAKCRELITPYLTKEEKEWLILYTAPIQN